MIVITKASANTVILTLTEKVSLATPYFLFEFKNDITDVSQYFIAADISTQKERYNKFTITEKASPNALIGEVTLTLKESYSYFIREQASSTNLDPALSGAIVERGKVKVVGTAETVYTYSPSETKYVYNG